MMTKVIDVSKHQKTLAPAVAKAAGIQRVMVRHAYAATPDEQALSWSAAILQQGLPLGGYGFATWHYKDRNGGNIATARALMEKQVKVWITCAQQSGCDYWFAVDQELEAGHAMGLGKADNTALLNEACDMLADAGLHPCVYCSVAWDMNYIRTADLRYPYWLARYVNGNADFGSVDACLDTLPDGSYTRWMRKLQDAGKLVGWQFASTGYGKKYGAESDNIDRNVFYITPNQSSIQTLPVQPEPLEQYVMVGPMTNGDADAVEAAILQMQVEAEVVRAANGDYEGMWFVWTKIPVSTGDQAALIQLATKLQVPVELMDKQPGEKQEEDIVTADPEQSYSVVYMGFVVKGGFEDEAAAREYVESILGAEAMQRISGIAVEV